MCSWMVCGLETYLFRICLLACTVGGKRWQCVGAGSLVGAWFKACRAAEARDAACSLVSQIKSVLLRFQVSSRDLRCPCWLLLSYCLKHMRISNGVLCCTVLCRYVNSLICNGGIVAPAFGVPESDDR